MALTITDTEITSDMTTVFAERRGEHWVVSSYPDGDWVFDRNQAIAAVTIAEELEKPEPDQLLLERLRRDLP
jgi:hypothetical protein